MENSVGGVGFALTLSGCSGGYREENLSLGEMILVNDLVEVEKVSHHGYCKADTCWLGSDSTSTTYEVQFLADADTVVAAMRQTLPGEWHLDEIFCQGPNDDCEWDAYFGGMSGDSAVTITFQDRTGGAGLIYIDAHVD